MSHDLLDESFDNYHTDDKIPIHSHAGGLTSMTICIGALCDNGESAILITDRMTTNGSCFNYQIEDESIKIHYIQNGCYVMDSNNAQTAQEIIGLAQTLEANLGIDAVMQAFDSVRLTKAEELFLKTRGFTFKDYREGNIAPLILQVIDREIENYKLDVSFLVLQWDESIQKYRLYLLEEKTSIREYSQLGVCCIGNSFQIAEFLILDSQYQKKLSIDCLKPILLSIKTKLHVFPGIGTTHDIVCLSKGKIVESTID